MPFPLFVFVDLAQMPSYPVDLYRYIRIAAGVCLSAVLPPLTQSLFSRRNNS